MNVRQLKLLPGPTPQPAQATSPVMRVYLHALFMFGKNPARCGLGPMRRRLLAVWLTVFDEETLMLAFEGAAGDEWVREHGGRFTTPEWILKDEANIERYAAEGELLREQFRAATESAAPVQPPVAPEDEAKSHEAMERFRRYVALRGGSAG